MKMCFEKYLHKCINMPLIHPSRLFLLCAALFSAPFFAGAQVVINEIAWMGTVADPNGSYCEWIELSNTGLESVYLNGWTLSIGATTKIFSEENGATLSIAPGSFYLIERLTPSACPDPVPGISADWSVSFGSGISNSGTIIALLDALNVLIDRVDGSDGWKIGGGEIKGNNTTKETAGRSGNAWITATSTPRASNVSAPATNDSTSKQETFATNTSDSNSNNTSSGGSSGTGQAALPQGSTGSFFAESTMKTYAGPDRTALAGSTVLFLGRATGPKGEPVTPEHFSWNFGDGTVLGGENVNHTYRYPGNYVVVLHAVSGKYTASDYARVRVIPADIVIGSADKAGAYVEIANKANMDIDISFFRIRAGMKEFTIPERTIFAQGASIRFVGSMTGLSFQAGDPIMILYPNGETLFSFSWTPIETAVPLVSRAGGVQTLSPKTIAEPSLEKSGEVLGTSASSEAASATSSILTPLVSSPAEGDKNKNDMVWWIALFGVIIISAASVLWVRKKSRLTAPQKKDMSADNFTITDISEKI